MLAHYDQGGLIIFGKANNFFNTNLISEEDIAMFYELVIDVNGKFQKNPYQITLLSCILYDQSLTSPKHEELFFNWIISKLNRTDPIDRANLYRIYNIVEYEDKFRKCNDNQYDFLIEYLDRFVSFEKTLEEFLLFKYYKGILHLIKRNYVEALKENMEILTSINEEIPGQKSFVIQYILIKNSLLALRLYNEDKSSDNLNEYSTQANQVFHDMKSVNKVLAIKIGIRIYEIYKKKNQYDNCLRILKEISTILKRELLNGKEIEFGINYYLAIASRLAYVATFLNDKILLKKSMKKLEKTINLLASDSSMQTPSESLLNQNDYLNKTAYNFVMLIYNINSNSQFPQSRANEIVQRFKTTFIIPHNNSLAISYGRLLSTGFFSENDLNSSKINILAINNLDSIAQNAHVHINNLISKSQQDILQTYEIIPFIFGVYNILSGLSVSLLSDPNKAKQEEYKKKIKQMYDVVYQFVNKKSILAIFRLPYIRKALIKIYLAYIGVLFKEKDNNNISKAINDFDNILKKIEYNTKDENTALLKKIKGDFYFKSGKYKESINEYENSLNNLKEMDNNKAIILFNLGCCYFLLNDGKKSSQNLNNSVNIYNNMIAKLSGGPANLQYKYQEKVKIAESILSSMN
jgi:tetratricopeptide (TPR) repeat protein